MADYFSDFTSGALIDQGVHNGLYMAGHQVGRRYHGGVSLINPYDEINAHAAYGGEIIALVRCDEDTGSPQRIYTAKSAFWLWRDNDGSAMFTRKNIGGDTESLTGNAGDIPLGKWVWVRVSWRDGESSELWVNHAQVSTGVVGTSGDADTDYKAIGGAETAQDAWRGMIARVALLNYRQTAAEWKAFMASGALAKGIGGHENIVNFVTNPGSQANLGGDVDSFETNVPAAVNTQVRLNPIEDSNARFEGGWYRATFYAEFLAGSGDVSPIFRAWDGSNNVYLTITENGAYEAMFRLPDNANLEFNFQPDAGPQGLRVTGLKVVPVGKVADFDMTAPVTARNPINTIQAVDTDGVTASRPERCFIRGRMSSGSAYLFRDGPVVPEGYAVGRVYVTSRDSSFVGANFSCSDGNDHYEIAAIAQSMPSGYTREMPNTGSYRSECPWLRVSTSQLADFFIELIRTS